MLPTPARAWGGEEGEETMQLTRRKLGETGRKEERGVCTYCTAHMYMYVHVYANMFMCMCGWLIVVSTNCGLVFYFG